MRGIAGEQQVVSGGQMPSPAWGRYFAVLTVHDWLLT